MKMYSLKDITELVFFIVTTLQFKTGVTYDPYSSYYHAYKFVKTKDLCTEGTYCNARLLGDDHTMCVLPSIPPSTRCPREVLEAAVNLEMKIFIVHFINYKRNLVATGLEAQGRPGPQPPASKMPYISWDLELANDAQRWANQCLIKDDFLYYAKSRNSNVKRYKVRQYVHVIKDPEVHSVLSWNRTLNLWYNEVMVFNRNTLDRFSEYDQHIGAVHYTQILWEGTINIGCGYSKYRYKNLEYFVEVMVCNFGPAGNINEHSVYTVGAPCSECKNSCSFKFHGLCDSPY